MFELWEIVMSKMDMKRIRFVYSIAVSLYKVVRNFRICLVNSNVLISKA